MVKQLVDVWKDPINKVKNVLTVQKDVVVVQVQKTVQIVMKVFINKQLLVNNAR